MEEQYPQEYSEWNPFSQNSEPKSFDEMKVEDLPKGIFEQIRSDNIHTYKSLTKEDLEKAIGEFFQKPQERSVKVITNQGGFDLFCKAMKERAFEAPDPENYYIIEK